MSVLEQIHRDLDMVRELVLPFFSDFPDKADIWLRTRNPLLGDISPYALIRLGRTHKVVQFIEACKADTAREVLG